MKELEIQYQKRAPLEKKIEKLEEERRDLLNRKRELSEESLKELAKAKEEREKLKAWPINIPISKIRNGEYERTNLEIMKKMLTSILDSKVKLIKKHTETIKKTAPQKMVDLQKEFEEENNALKMKTISFIKLSLEKIFNPQDLLLFTNELHSRNEPVLIILVAKKAIELIQNLEKLIENKRKIESDLKKLRNDKLDWIARVNIEQNAEKKKEFQQQLASIQAQLTEKEKEALGGSGETDEEVGEGLIPKFIDLNKQNQFNKMKKKIMEQIVLTLSNAKLLLEEEIETKIYSDPNAIKIYKNHWKQSRREHKELENEVIAIIKQLSYNQPMFFSNLIQTIKRNQYDFNKQRVNRSAYSSDWTDSEYFHFLDTLIEYICFSTTQNLLNIKNVKEKLNEHEEIIQLLKAEESDLFIRKKQLENEDKQILEESQEEAEKLIKEIPISKKLQEIPKINEMMENFVFFYFENLLENKKKIEKLIENKQKTIFSKKVGSATDEYEHEYYYYENLKKENQIKLTSGYIIDQFIAKFIKNPFFIYERLLNCYLHKINDSAVNGNEELDLFKKLCEFTQKNLFENLKKQIKNQNHLKSGAAKLKDEQKKLDIQFRKLLDREKQLELREYLLMINTFAKKESFYQISLETFDNKLREFMESQLNFVYYLNYRQTPPNSKAQAASDPKGMAGRILSPKSPQNSSNPSTEHLPREKYNELLRNVISLTLDEIDSIKNLIEISSYFTGMREYSSVIVTSLRCQEKIKEEQKLIQEIELLNKRIEYLENNVYQDLSLEAELEASVAKRKELTESQKFTADTLKEYLIQSSEICSNAALIETRSEIIIQQALISFKADPSELRWDRIRSVCSESEWGAIKEELVSFILMDTKKNVYDKIDLLIRDGLWSHCIDIFPQPNDTNATTVDTTKMSDGDDVQENEQITRLTEVWIGIAKFQPEHLSRMLKIVERYVKYYFQLFQFSVVYPVLDHVQRRFPDFIVKTYVQAIDMILISILPSQYCLLVVAMKDLKARLQTIGRPDDWAKFLADFISQYKSKKRLIQMVSRITDSSYNLESLLKKENSKKRPRSSSPSPKVKSEKAKIVKVAPEEGNLENEEELDPEEEPPKKKKAAPRRSRSPKKKY